MKYRLVRNGLGEYCIEYYDYKQICCSKNTPSSKTWNFVRLVESKEEGLRFLKHVEEFYINYAKIQQKEVIAEAGEDE